jgi:hypothetical protein
LRGRSLVLFYNISALYSVFWPDKKGGLK